ncbi:acetylcholinesterase-like [Amblyomma americanum]
MKQGKSRELTTTTTSYETAPVTWENSGKPRKTEPPPEGTTHSSAKSPEPSATGSILATAEQRGRPEEKAAGSSTEQDAIAKEAELGTSRAPPNANGHVQPSDAAHEEATASAPAAEKDDRKAAEATEPPGSAGRENDAKELPAKVDSAKPERSATCCRSLLLVLLALFAVSLSVAVVILALVEHLRNRDRPVIKGPFGTVRGQRLVFADQGRDWTVHAFLGIPFAQFPGGGVRFKPPLPLNAPLGGNRSGQTLESMQKRPPCPQQDFYLGLENVSTSNGSEDCLHLNIWAPPWNCDQEEPAHCEQRTVLFFLYGASFQNGGNSFEQLYDGRYLSALGDLVVVVPNYRVGALGFLSGPSAKVLPGNAGLHDQQLALSWTLDNIDIFGGNASRVVLAGHDAGAASLGYHLFRGDAAVWTRNVARYIFQSGGPYHRYQDDGPEGARRLAASVDCIADLATEAGVQCLQTTDVAAVARSPLAPRFMPVFSRPPLSQPGGEERQTGPQGRRFLLGRVESEGAYPWFLEKLRSGSGDPRRIASQLLGRRVLDRWEIFADTTRPPSEMHYQRAVGDVLELPTQARCPRNRAQQACPMSELAEQLHAWQNAVYVYVLGYRPKYSSWRNQTEAVHFEDMHLVFGMPLRPEVPSSDLDKRWARTMIHVWATFARTGKAPEVLGSKWPSYDSIRPSFMKLGPGGASVESDDKRARCDFLRGSH